MLIEWRAAYRKEVPENDGSMYSCISIYQCIQCQKIVRDCSRSDADPAVKPLIGALCM